MADFKTRILKKGEVVYRQNDYETFFYEVLYGGVTLYQDYGTKTQVLVKEILPGSFFGQLEVVEARPRTTTAVATEKSELKVISKDDFGALFHERPALVMTVMQQMSARIRELTQQYNDACRIVSESMDAEKEGRAKSEKLQAERRSLSDFYHKLIGKL